MLIIIRPVSLLLFHPTFFFQSLPLALLFFLLSAQFFSFPLFCIFLREKCVCRGWPPHPTAVLRAQWNRQNHPRGLTGGGGEGQCALKGISKPPSHNITLDHPTRLLKHMVTSHQGGRKRLPKFKFSAKFPIGVHVILQIQIKKFENDCYIMWKIILTENPSRCNLAPLLK